MELGSRNLNKTMKVSYTFTDILVYLHRYSYTFTDICIPSQIIKNICESEQISVKLPSRRLNKNQINVGKNNEYSTIERLKSFQDKKRNVLVVTHKTSTNGYLNESLLLTRQRLLKGLKNRNHFLYNKVRSCFSLGTPENKQVYLCYIREHRHV